jgi:hypothetical protein
MWHPGTNKPSPKSPAAQRPGSAERLAGLWQGDLGDLRWWPGSHPYFKRIFWPCLIARRQCSNTWPKHIQSTSKPLLEVMGCWTDGLKRWTCHQGWRNNDMCASNIIEDRKALNTRMVLNILYLSPINSSQFGSAFSEIMFKIISINTYNLYSDIYKTT